MRLALLLLLILPRLLWSDVLVVYVSNKETRPVKTRLAKGTSPEVAEAFYDYSLDILTEDLEVLSDTFTIVIAPANVEDEAWAKERWPDYQILPQTDSPNLGTRIQTTFDTLFEEGHERVLLMGSDAPSLPLGHIHACLACLETDTVLGPSDDGGFYLIGSRTPLPNLTSVRWSSPYAREDTYELLINAGLTNTTGPFWYDIDIVEDLWRLERDLEPTSPARRNLLDLIQNQTRVTVIIPTLNEQENVLPLGAALRSLKPPPEVLFVDGGSDDDTVLTILRGGFLPLSVTPPNRGRQLNTGIEKAKGQILLFLHADTLIDQKSYQEMLTTLEDPGCYGGAFCYALQGDDWRCRVIEKGVHLRNTLFKMPYGDQGYFIKRSALPEVGLFQEIRLMEDVEWFTRLKKTGHYRILKETSTTSPRRIFTRGWIRSAATNITLITLYKLGADPEELAQFY